MTAVGRDEATLAGFFELLGARRCSLITHVGARIANVAKARCPNAVLYAHAFPLVKWATEGLDEVQRGTGTTRAPPLGETRRSRRSRPRRDAPPGPVPNKPGALENARHSDPPPHPHRFRVQDPDTLIALAMSRSAATNLYRTQVRATTQAMAPPHGTGVDWLSNGRAVRRLTGQARKQP